MLRAAKVKDGLDDYTHWYVNKQFLQGKQPSLIANIYYAGMRIGSETDAYKAIDVIYGSMDRLKDKGVPDGTPVRINAGEGVPSIDTDISKFMLPGELQKMAGELDNLFKEGWQSVSRDKWGRWRGSGVGGTGVSPSEAAVKAAATRARNKAAAAGAAGGAGQNEVLGYVWDRKNPGQEVYLLEDASVLVGKGDPFNVFLVGINPVSRGEIIGTKSGEAGHSTMLNYAQSSGKVTGGIDDYVHFYVRGDRTRDEYICLLYTSDAADE